MESIKEIFDEFNLKGYFSILQATLFTEKALTILDDYDETISSVRRDAIELAMKIIDSQSTGSIKNYYDYAITFARVSEYDISCEIFDCGLKRYPRSVDLLAGYLICSINSSKIEHYNKSVVIYKKLLTMRPRLWNWRAYDFSISYLLDKTKRDSDKDLDDIYKECLELAHEFQKREPNNELSYVLECDVYFTFQEKNKSVNLLKRVMKRKNINIVRIGISLAEVYMYDNQPLKANECLNRVMVNITNPSVNITPTYAYILLITSKAAQFIGNKYSEKSKNNDVLIDQKILVQQILDDWKNVKKISNIDERHIIKSTQNIVNFIEVISGISADDEL